MRGLLATPPTDTGGATAAYIAANLGSPYPAHLRRQSLSSELSEESPIHQLDLQTPFLRPAPLFQDLEQAGSHANSLSAAATVLANRARQPVRGITEDWIRQHTAGDSDRERRHWLSDGTGDSENSSLSGSFSGDEAAWLADNDHRTPRAIPGNNRQTRQPSRRYPRKQSSSETLKQARLNQQLDEQPSAKMASSEASVSPDQPGDIAPEGYFHQEQAPASIALPSTPKREFARPDVGNSGGAPRSEQNAPVTPSRTPAKRVPPSTPRLKKRVPWRGKNIMISIPRDDERGQPGQAPMPLNETAVTGMLRSWDELGYNTDGFDLDIPAGISLLGEYSQSRGAWPNLEDLSVERATRKYTVVLPDLNG